MRKDSKGKREYHSKKIRSRRKQLRLAREVKRRAPNKPNFSDSYYLVEPLMLMTNDL